MNTNSENKNVIETLNEFVDIALRNRKYTPNTAYGLKAALKVFESELNSDENSSINLFRERFEQIFNTIVNKKQKDFNISSLQVYKRRILYIMRDYEKYGVDPSKMSNWNPVFKKSSPRSNKAVEKNTGNSDQVVDEAVSFTENSRHEYSVRLNKKIIISYPQDFTLEEAKSIKSFAEYLVSMKSEDKS